MHPTLERLIARCANKLTSARTAKGLLRAIRKHGLPREVKTPYEPRKKWVKHALHWRYGELAAQSECQERNRRLSNWRNPQPTLKSDLHLSYTTNTIHYKGSFRGRTGGEYTPRYYSEFRFNINSGKVGAWSYLDKENVMHVMNVRAPRGYRFDVDVHGVKLVSLSCSDDDYHFDGDDLMQGVSFLRSCVITNRNKRMEDKRTRRRSKSEEKVFYRLLPKLQVRLQDSIRAGNCVAGTLAYAERRGISRDQALKDPSAFLPGEKIDQDDTRAMNAARAAFQRETMVCI